MHREAIEVLTHEALHHEGVDTGVIQSWDWLQDWPAKKVWLTAPEADEDTQLIHIFYLSTDWWITLCCYMCVSCALLCVLVCCFSSSVASSHIHFHVLICCSLATLYSGVCMLRRCTSSTQCPILHACVPAALVHAFSSLCSAVSAARYAFSRSLLHLSFLFNNWVVAEDHVCVWHIETHPMTKQ